MGKNKQGGQGSSEIKNSARRDSSVERSPAVSVREGENLPPAPPFPELESGKPSEIWSIYFAAHRPAPRVVSSHVEKLHRQGEHEHVISLIQSAIINGQSQPWMYEVLALSMDIQGRDKKEIDRVVLSLTDFGTVNFGTMMYSAAYLVRLGRESAALKLYRQASRIAPERPEPYLLGLKLARAQKDVDAIEWAAVGVLLHAWTRDFRKLHREAEDVALEAERALRKQGLTKRADELKQALNHARHRDLRVRVTWSGEGDLDLIVEEPHDQACSLENPETLSGGILLHDGFGPDSRNAYEEYACPAAYSGDYRLRVTHAWGNIVGNRCVVTVIMHQGTPQEQVITRSMTVGSEDAVLRIKLENGRRQSNRLVVTRHIKAEVPTADALLRQGRDKKLSGKAMREFAESRGEIDSRTIRRAGAIGFRPVIQVIPDGATLQAQAIVSPDRRYVRIGVVPTFSNITDVFTFTTVAGIAAGNGGNGFGGN